MIKQILFPHQAVMPHREPVIRSEEDVGIVLFPALFEGIENATDLVIHVGDDGIVLPAVDLHRIDGSGKRSELFIAEAFRTAIDLVFPRDTPGQSSSAWRFDRAGSGRRIPWAIAGDRGVR